MGGDWTPFLADVIINLKTRGGDTVKGQGLDIVQGNLNLLEGVESFERFIDLIFIGAGSSAIFNTGSAMKTSSEIFADQEITNETLRMLKQLRIDQITRICSKALIIGIKANSPLLKGFQWNGEGEPPFVLSFPPEENMNKMLEIEQSMLLINNNLSDHITELAKMHSISKEEAQTRLDEILANNKKMFDGTIYKLEAEQQGADKQGQKQSSYIDKFKSGVNRK